MSNFKIFSEIYGCYFSVVEKIINQAKNGLSEKEIENLIQSEAFYDSSFYLLPKIFSNEWAFIEKKDNDIFYTKDTLNTLARPLTLLEKSWLKAILLDKKMALFIFKDNILALNTLLKDVEPLFTPNDFYVFDTANDGDPYEDDNYITTFKSIIKAIQLNKMLNIDYDSTKKKSYDKNILPYKIIYSSRDDKFRLLCLLINRNHGFRTVNLNIARIISCNIIENTFPNNFNIKKYLYTKIHSEPITLIIYKERNALERFMLQFSAWEKETEYDEENNFYICKLYYEKQDETELLIRILSFGPVIKVVGNDVFLAQIKERVNKQYKFNELYST